MEKVICIKPYGADKGERFGFNTVKGRKYLIEPSETDCEYSDVYDLKGKWLERSKTERFK